MRFMHLHIIEVSAMGRKSSRALAWEVLGIGITVVFFHAAGTKPSSNRTWNNLVQTCPSCSAHFKPRFPSSWTWPPCLQLPPPLSHGRRGPDHHAQQEQAYLHNSNDRACVFLWNRSSTFWWCLWPGFLWLHHCGRRQWHYVHWSLRLGWLVVSGVWGPLQWVLRKAGCSGWGAIKNPHQGSLGPHLSLDFPWAAGKE